MNFAFKIFLILFSVSSPLFCQQIPLRKSGVIAIPILTIEVPEANSLESCATAVTSKEMSTGSSAQITPVTSTSPTRRDSADMELDELLSEQKIFERLKNSCNPEYKRVFFSALEKRLDELSQKARVEKEEFLKEERFLATKPFYADFPGSSPKAYHYTIRELQDAEDAAMPYILSECPYK